MKKEKKKHLERLAARREERRQAREKKFEYTGDLLTGTISIAPAGFGFVRLETDPENPPAEPVPDWFIPAKYLNGAMHGDIVRIAPLPPDPRYPEKKESTAGRVIEIAHHTRATFVGLLISADRVRPLDKHLPDDILISSNPAKAKKGDWVEVKPDFEGVFPKTHKVRRNHIARRLAGISGTVVRRLGPGGILRADLDAVCAEYHLPEFYSAEDEARAKEVVPREIERVDLKDRFTVTIDPFDAKDYDDAVSIAPGDSPETVEVGTHIAEVAAYLPPGTHFDKLAGERGFTAYLPGRTINMLPKGLTAQISMTAGIDAPSHSVLMQVERATGKIVSARRVHGEIHVDHRLNYDEVQNFIDGKPAPETWPEELQKHLLELHEITAKMRRYRKVEELFLDLEIPEIRVICDEESNRILGLDSHIQRPAEAIVEECMLAANSAVAAELTEKHIPGLFRIHAEPEPEKIEEFAALSEGAFGIPVGDLSSRQGCKAYLDKLPDTPAKTALLGAFLRAMQRACYEEEPSLHFGLGKTLYSHFTSPIRRYPDLLVHQQLWAYDLHEPLKSKETLNHWGEKLSALEQNNDDAYFAASNRMKLRYLEEMLAGGKENLHSALVIKVTGAGAVIELQELGLQGFVEAPDLPGGYRDPGKALAECTPGKTLTVCLESIDYVKATANFRAVKERTEK